jgi:hypothetical protein
MNEVSDRSLDTLRQAIRGQMNDISNNIIGGGCTDFAEYTHQTGVIKGLAIAERELLDLDKRIEDE